MEFKAEPIIHNNRARIAVYFEKRADLNERIKKQPDAQWSNTLKAWHLPDTEANRKLLKINTPVNTISPKNEKSIVTATPVNTLRLSEEAIVKTESFKRWLRSKRYSENTIKTYTEALISFLKYFNNKPIHTINNQDIIDFNNDYIIAQKLSASYQNQIVNAIKLFFIKIENSKINVALVHRPKRYNPLPKVLAIEEITAIINALDNIKHKCMISLIYSAGLRRSELLNMKIKHVDSQRMELLIKHAKGNKDRIVPLSESLLELLREYYKAHKPKEYLFEGQTGDQYNERSLALVLKNACIKAGIKKQVNLHMLRHSYATHLLETGTDLRFIQELLGHKSSRTTEIYTHVSKQSIKKIVSPLDKLNLKIIGN